MAVAVGSLAGWFGEGGRRRLSHWRDDRPRCGPARVTRTSKIAIVATTRLVLLLSVIVVSGCGEDSSRLRLATTTSVDNSGLLQAILPSFQQETGIDVQVLAVGN